MQHSSIRVPALGASIASLLILFSCVDQSATEPDGLRAGWSVGNRGGLTGALHVPTNSGVIGSGRALLVVLHGCAQSYGDLESYGNWVDTSEDYGTVISLPGVAGGGVYFGCWDYYGSSHSRGSGDAADLLAHVDALLADPTLDIDPNQVYIAGLSSGGGMAMVMGCLAPDVFAGVGIAAGPTVGTSAFQTASVSTSLATAQATCETLAGSHADDFATQHMAAISGTNDYTVAQGYTQLNADVFAALYADAAGLPSLSSSPLVVEDLPGFNPAGVGTVYEDELGPRALRISATGMGHAWPAGSGSGPEIGFVATQGVDFARVLVEMLTAGNRRVVGGGLSGGGTGGESSDGGDDLGTTGSSSDGGDDLGTTGGSSDGGDELGTTGGSSDGGDELGTGGSSGGGGSEDGAGEDPPCEPWVDVVVATITGHFPRFSSYPGGYGVADMTYVALFGLYGMYTAFPLYQAADGDWYHDPANVPGCE